MEEVAKAIGVLNNGGIIIYPTDTAFGMGCRIDDEKAVKRLFKIRKRPVTQAAPVLVSSIEMAAKYVQKIPIDVQGKLISKYWPGALTIVLLCKLDKVPSLVRGGEKTLGVRIPDHKIALSIIEGVGVPILGPSANFSGEQTPYKFEDLDPELVKLVDYVVHGETSTGKVSTCIDVSQKPWKILRQGAVKLKIKNLKSKIILLIDSSNNKEIKVGLRFNEKEHWVTKKHKKAQETLSLIEKLLKEKKIKLNQINEIKVNTGPGSFTGLRVGVSIANALGFALKIPVNGKKVGEQVTPVYTD